jgi:hypothetical protein
LNAGFLIEIEMATPGNKNYFGQSVYLSLLHRIVTLTVGHLNLPNRDPMAVDDPVDQCHEQTTYTTAFLLCGGDTPF